MDKNYKSHYMTNQSQRKAGAHQKVNPGSIVSKPNTPEHDQELHLH